MKENNLISWKMHTARNWEDLQEVMELIKIDFIDHDHQILVELSLKLNQYIKALEAGYSMKLIQMIKDLLNELYDYAVAHFDREEVFMTTYELPNREKHFAEHERILTTLKHAIEDFNHGKINVSYELKKNIMDWLMRHINYVDMHFFELDNWSDNLLKAMSYDDVKDIITLVGINAIDDQHKELTIQAINLFNEISNQADIVLVFEEFEKKVRYHFDYESAFMKRYMTDTQYHENEHDFFMRELHMYKNDLKSKEVHLDDFKLWLLKWWINHINVTDHDAFRFENWIPKVIAQAESIDDLKELLRKTHVKEIDDDHLAVMHLTFQLNQSVENSDGDSLNRNVLDLMKQIVNKAKVHFQREELIMEKYNLNDASAHMSEHANIIYKLNEMIDHYEAKRLYASQNIKNMILDWWINHTNTVDYRTFVLNVSEEQYKQLKEEAHHVQKES